MPRFQIAGAPRRVVGGTGWRAEFEGGAFESDEERIVEGLRRYARQFPEARITEVDEPAQPDAPVADEAPGDQDAPDPEPRGRGRRGRGRARQSAEERQAVYDEAHAAGILEEPATADEDDGVDAAAIEERDGETVLVEQVAGETEGEDA